jgi:hypothetical protein
MKHVKLLKVFGGVVLLAAFATQASADVPGICLIDTAFGTGALPPPSMDVCRFRRMRSGILFQPHPRRCRKSGVARSGTHDGNPVGDPEHAIRSACRSPAFSYSRSASSTEMVVCRELCVALRGRRQTRRETCRRLPQGTANEGRPARVTGLRAASGRGTEGFSLGWEPGIGLRPPG